ncbi:hypothetical protein ScPMuIL_014128 [Solemya velum]
MLFLISAVKIPNDADQFYVRLCVIAIWNGLWKQSNAMIGHYMKSWEHFWISLRLRSTMKEELGMAYGSDSAVCKDGVWKWKMHTLQY